MKKNSNLWPIVTITAVVITALTVILATTPANDAATRSAVLALLATIVPTIIGVWLKASVDDVKSQVDAVQQQTNGHMTQLISAKTTPEVTKDAVQGS